MKNLTKNIATDNGLTPRIDLSSSQGGRIITFFDNVPVDYITINQNLTDPSQIVTGDIAGDQIKYIRNNSHRVLGKKTGDGIITICRLSDSNSNNYYDGTPASLDGSEGDSFVRLPEFYYSAEETETDVWKIGFSSKSFPGSKKWDSNNLIGTYEAYYGDNKLQSISGVSSSGNISQERFIQYSRNRGTGYMIVDWYMHCIMAFLFYAWYGNTNSQKICGAGTDSYRKTTGETNSLGMTDTEGGVIGEGNNSTWDTSKNGNQGSINFWGLENWWGNKYEWIEGIEWGIQKDSDSSIYQIAKITNPDGSTRTATCPSPVNVQTMEGTMLPTKFTIGEYLDLIPKGGLSQQELKEQFPNMNDKSYDINYGYSDGCTVADIMSTIEDLGDTSSIPSGFSSVYVVYRSGYDSLSSGGVSCSVAGSDSSYSGSSYGSRLAFRGEVREASSVSEYKSISI